MAHEVDILPTILNPGDPSAGDESRFRPSDPANYAEFAGGALSEAALHVAERAFHDVVQAWLAGEGPFDALLPFVDRLVLDPFEHHDKRPILPAEVPLPDRVLADIVEDEVPDAGVLVERITGDPFRLGTVGEMAALAWLETLGKNRRAVDAWADDERDRALVCTMNRIDRAPPCLYVDGVPQLPMNRKMIPANGPPGVYVARAYLVGTAWMFSSKVDLPACPDLGPLLRRLRVELWRLRVFERRCTWEDGLRQRPDVVYRAASEGARLKVSLGGPK